jgi:hypothetical protein
MPLFEKEKLATGHVDGGRRITVSTGALDVIFRDYGIVPTAARVDGIYIPLTSFKEPKRANPRMRSVEVDFGSEFPERGHFSTPILGVDGTTVLLGKLRFTEANALNEANEEIKRLKAVGKKNGSAVVRVGQGPWGKLIKRVFSEVIPNSLKRWMDAGHLCDIGAEKQFGYLSGFPIPNLHRLFDKTIPYVVTERGLEPTAEFLQALDDAVSYLKNPRPPEGKTPEELAQMFVVAAKAKVKETA